MFSWRYLNTDDYHTLTKWWKEFRFPIPLPGMLPQNGLGGIMVMKEDVELCAGFLYLTNSSFCWIEYVISNFSYKNKDRKDAIVYMINQLEIIAKQTNQCTTVYCTVKNKNLINRYLEADYTDCGQATVLVKNI